MRGILKNSDGNSPVRSSEAHRRKDDKMSKREASSAVLPGNQLNNNSVEDTIDRLEQEERDFLETIEDSFTKLFLKTQYNLSNDVAKSFLSVSNNKEGSNSLLTTKSGDSAVFKDRLLAYTLGRAIQQQEYVQYEDTSNDGGLFTRKIEQTIQKGEEVLENSFKFVNMVRNLTQQAKKLNDSFSKTKALKLKGALNDPVMQKYKNSGIVNRLMNNDKSPLKDWKKIEEKLRGKELDTIDLSKKMRVYSTLVDELSENDGYLCKILSHNLVKMIVKMKNYEEFNDTLNDEEEDDEDIYYKYEPTNDFKGPHLQISSKLLHTPDVLFSF
jgi:hypothetical protein